MESSRHARIKWAGIVAVVTGLVTVGLAFPAGASAGAQAVTSTASCASNSWIDTVTATNTPDPTTGVATVSGTGTALDGRELAAGGGQQTVSLTEPLTVATVTVAGELTWPGGFHAPFTTTAKQPANCGTAQVNAAAAPAVSVLVDTPNVTLCHASNSDTNPYGKITVDAAGAFSAHLGDTGPVWDPTLKDNKIQWGDIIPPFEYQGTTYSLNWDAAGMAIWNNNCNIPSVVTTTATATVPGPTVTVTGPTTTVTVTVPVTTTATVTSPGPTVTVPGPTTTVIVPGPTITLTETATVTNTATTTQPGPTSTVTVTQPGTTVTQTQPANTVTVTQPGTTATVTQVLNGTVSTVTERVTEAPVTVTVTNGNGIGGESANCPPGSGVQGGSLAYTGSGNDALMSLLGGALTAGGLVCLIMARKPRGARQH